MLPVSLRADNIRLWYQRSAVEEFPHHCRSVWCRKHWNVQLSVLLSTIPCSLSLDNESIDIERCLSARLSLQTRGLQNILSKVVDLWMRFITNIRGHRYIYISKIRREFFKGRGVTLGPGPDLGPALFSFGPPFQWDWVRGQRELKYECDGVIQVLECAALHQQRLLPHVLELGDQRCVKHFNFFLCSIEGKQRPQPFRQGNLHPTPQTWRDVAEERFFEERKVVPVLNLYQKWASPLELFFSIKSR